jgi:hypothetical protein
MATDMMTQLATLVQGGMPPEQAIQYLRDAQAQQFAKMPVKEQLASNIGMYAGRVGQGLLRAAGVEDPMLAQASKMRDMATQFDTSTADGMMQYAKALQSVNPALAQQAAMKARELALEESKLTTEKARQGQIAAQEQRAMAETKAKEAQTSKAARYEEAINALPPDATDADVEAVTRKFGKPEDVLKAVSRRQEVEAKKQAALELAKEKAALEAAQKERDAAFRRELAAATAANRSALTGVQQQIAQQRLDDLKEKAAERTDKKESAKQAALSHANKVLGDVAETNTLVKSSTTGIVGKPTSFIPGTDAYNLNQRLLTIKANLGFDRLQQMRDASPTGGALGQVAVQELQALQATVGSLDIGQDSKELAKNLSKIEHHYSNWIRTTRGEQTISFEEFQKAKQPAPQAPAGGWSIKPKQ